MTGYTVNTGSTEKFSTGWDRVFSDNAGKKADAKKSAAGKKGSKSAATKMTASKSGKAKTATKSGKSGTRDK